MTVIFLCYSKRLMITKNSVVKFQNLVVNHKSQLVKSNPAFFGLLFSGPGLPI